MNHNDIYDVILLKDITRKDVVNIFQADFWAIWDEIQRDEKHPYEIIWAADDDGETLVSYIQDFIVGMDYLLIRGENVSEVVNDVKVLFDKHMYTKMEVISLWKRSSSRNEKIKSIYQVAVIASSEFDEEIYSIFQNTASETDKDVRLAAVWGMSYIAWPEIQFLVNRYATEDPDAEVQDVAKSLQQAYKTGVGLGFSRSTDD